MKKLMILGGSRYIIPVIQKAHELGCYVITCDYLPNNFAHKFSDEYCNVSVIEKESVLEAAERLKIDGIISFACDPGVVSAAYTAEKLGLPFQGSFEAVSILQDKGLFRKFLADNNFNTPKAKRYIDIAEALNDTDYFTWPVIVKPTDSAGSKGVNRVDSPENLLPAVKTAVANSHNGAFIIEEFLNITGFRSDSDHFTINGKLIFSAYDEQFFDSHSPNPYTPAKYIFPSAMKNHNQEILTHELQRLMKLLDMKTGLYNIEACIGIDGKPYIMEVSPRGGGNKLAELEDMAYNTSLVENEIRSALNMPLIDFETNLCSGNWCSMVIHTKNSGIFKKLTIDNEIMENYVKLLEVWKNEGDIVRPFTGANMSFGHVFLRFNDREELESIMSHSDEWMNMEIYA